MKFRLLIPLVALSGLLLSCQGEKSSATDEEPAKADPASEGKPADPAAKAALEAQVIGSKLLGNTVRLSGDSFQPADLDFAPEAYFVYYSASW